MRLIRYVIVFLIGAILAFAVTHIDVVSGPSTQLPDINGVRLELTYTDFVTVMFTGATLVLAGVALFVGLVAIFTYRGIKEEARRTIRMAVNKKMETLDKRIEREVGEEAEEKITRAIERAGRNGSLDRALERALIAIGQGGTKLTGELEKGFEPGDQDEER